MIKIIYLRLLLMTLSLTILFSLSIYSQQDSPRSKGPEKGSLLIIGGNASASIFLPEFSKLAGGWEVPIVIIPTASDDESINKDPKFEKLVQGFRDAGFTNITVLHTRNREDANNENFIQHLQEAKGVWFTGGRQWRLADSYLNTKVHDAITEVLEKGGVVAGSSAGATIQGSFLARGDTKKNTIMDGDHTEGLSLISNVAIDQHLLARNRQFDMFEILENHPHLLGIGLDENTGIIVRHNTFEVIGESYVAIYDGTRWSAERDTVYQLPEGSKEFYNLKKGEKYDLYNRKVIIEDD